MCVCVEYGFVRIVPCKAQGATKVLTPYPIWVWGTENTSYVRIIGIQAGVVAQTFKSRTQGAEAEAGRSLSSRSTWSTW